MNLTKREGDKSNVTKNVGWILCLFRKAGVTQRSHLLFSVIFQIVTLQKVSITIVTLGKGTFSKLSPPQTRFFPLFFISIFQPHSCINLIPRHVKKALKFTFFSARCRDDCLQTDSKTTEGERS